MEENFPTSLLLVAGVLRLAVTCRSEPWSGHSADQHFLHDGPMTAKSHLVSVREEATDAMTPRFERLISDLANDGISLLHEVSGTEAEGITTYSFTIPENSEQSLLGGVISDHHSKAPVTSKPLITTVASKSKPISPLPKHLSTFSSTEEETGSDTMQTLSRNVKQSATIPGETNRLEATLPDSEPSEGAGQRVGLATSLSLATSTRNLPSFPQIKNRTESGGRPNETMQMSAEAGMEKLLTLISKASEPPRVKSAQTPPDIRTSNVATTPGLLAQLSSPSIKGCSTVIFQQPLSEKHAAITPRTKGADHYSSLASSPHGGIMEHETTELRMNENSALLTPSQSNTHLFPLLSTPKTLSSESFLKSARAEGISPSSLSKRLFPSQVPLFSKSSTSSQGEEHLPEVMNSVLHREIDLQTTTQTSQLLLSQTTGVLRTSLTSPNLQGTTTEDWPKVSVPEHSKAQPPGTLPLLYSKPRVSMSTTSPLAHSTSFHAVVTIVATSSPVESLPPLRSTAAPTSAPVTSKPLITTVVSKSKPISPLPKHLSTFSSMEEETGSDTMQTLSRNVKQSATIPGETNRLVATLPDSEPSEGAGQRVGLATSLSLATSTRNLPSFPQIKNRTESGGRPNETVQMSVEAGMEKLLTLISKASEPPRVKSAQTPPDIRTSNVARTPGLLAQLSSPSIKGCSTVIFQQPLSEKHAAITPWTKVADHYSSLASSPHGGIMEHEITELRMNENSALLTPSQSNTHLFPLLSTPKTLSSESFLKSARAEGISPSGLSKRLFPSQVPLFSKSSTSSQGEEHLPEVMNSVLHREIALQTTTQTSQLLLSQTAGALRTSLPAPNLQGTTTEDWPKVSVPEYSKAQPPGTLPLLYSKPRVSMPTTSPLAHSTSFHAVVTSVTTSSPVESLPPVRSTAASTGHTLQGTKPQLSETFSTVHSEPTSLKTCLPSHINSEPLALSSSPAQTKPETPGFHAGPPGPGLLAPSHVEPQHESEEPSIVPTMLAHTKPHLPRSFASPRAGLNTVGVTNLALSKPKSPVLSTLAYGELKGRALGTFASFQVKQQMLGNSASTHSGSAPLVEPDMVPDMSSAADLNVPGTSVLDHTETEWPSNISIPFYAKTPSLPDQVYANLQTPSVDPPAHHEQLVNNSGMNVSSHAKEVPPRSSAFLIDESHLLVTSVPAHAKPNTNGTLVEGGTPALIDVRPEREGAFASTAAKAQSLALSTYPQIEHQLSGVDAKPRTQPIPQIEAQTPKPNPSASAQLHSFDITTLGHLKERPPSTSAFVHTESPLLDTSLFADVGTQFPNILLSAPPALQTQVTTLLPVMLHTPGKQSEGKSSLQTSFPISQAGIDGTTLQGGPTPLSSRRSPGFDNPDSSISHHSKVNIPLLRPSHMEENILGLRTTSMLVGAGAQDLMQSSLDFIQHLKQSDDIAAGSLDSVLDSSYLGTSLPLQYSSHLVQNAESKVCLQGMQNTTPSSGELSASGQELLILSSALGFSHLSASNIIQMGPSSIILVKPVFVLPALLPSTGEGKQHQASLPFTNKAVLGLVMSGSSHEQQVEMSPPTLSTIQHSARPNILSSKAYLPDKRVISGPVITTFPRSEVRLVRSNNFTANSFPHWLRKLSTTTKYLATKNHNQGVLAPPLDSQALRENNPVALSVGTPVKQRISAAPPVMAPVLQRSQILPPPTELRTTSSTVSPLPSLLAPWASQILRSSLQISRTARKRQLSTMQMLHTDGHPYRSVTPITPICKNFEEHLSASSAGNMELPLEVGQHLTPSHGSLSTELLGKSLSKVRHVPNMQSDVLPLSTGKEHKESAALNDPSSAAAAPFPMATEMPSYHTNTTFSKSFYPISSKLPMANERLRTLPVSTLFSAGTPIEDIKNHQVYLGPSANVSSQVSRHFYFAKSFIRDSPTALMRSEKLSLVNTGEQKELTVSTGKINQSASGTEMHNQSEATSFVPTVPGTNSGHPSALLVATDFRSTSTSLYGTVGSIELQRWFPKSPLRTVHSFAPGSTLKDTTASPLDGEAALLETSHSGLNRLQSSVIGASKAEFFSPSASSKVQLLKLRRGETRGAGDHFLVASHFRPEPASLKGDHLERPGSLHDGWTQKAESSLPTASSPFSIVPHVPVFLMTPSATLTDGFLSRVLNQTSHLQSLPLGISETSVHTQGLLAPGKLSDTSNITADGDFSVDPTSSSGEFNESRLYTVEEQVAVITNPTGDGEGEEEEEEGALPPRDSDSSLLGSRAHHQRLTRSDDVFLDG